MLTYHGHFAVWNAFQALCAKIVMNQNGSSDAMG